MSLRNAAAGLACIGVLLAVSGAGAASDTAASPRHLIYLHGRIVQDQQSPRPRSPRFGYYELEKILQVFRDRGFVVDGEIRPKTASESESADRVVAKARRLLASGVPPGRLTIVGASMGASIALLTSARLQNPDVRYCLLGACLAESVRGLLAEEGKHPSGRFLAIREASDDLIGPCPTWKDVPSSRSTLVAREIVLHTGLSHGFLYRPMPEWVNPAAEWAGAAE